MSKRKKTRGQTISIFLSVLLFGATGLTQLVGSFQNNTPSVEPSPLPTFGFSMLEEELILDQTTSYQLSAGRIIALNYQAEMGQSITLYITSENDVAPILSIQAPNQSEVITPIDDITEICGFIFTTNDDYQFIFEAPIQSTYNVQVEVGNTCDNG
jgi:hypothetical protein